MAMLIGEKKLKCTRKNLELLERVRKLTESSVCGIIITFNTM